MIYWPSPDSGDDRRQRMIDETGAWLTWALQSEVKLPRIPRSRVEDGGFTQILKSPAARVAVYHWWSRTLELVENLGDRS